VATDLAGNQIVVWTASSTIGGQTHDRVYFQLLGADGTR